MTVVTAAPNDLWTADFKGEFRTGDGIYCYPLTIADLHARYLLDCHGRYSMQTRTAWPVFEAACARVWAALGNADRQRATICYNEHSMTVPPPRGTDTCMVINWRSHGRSP